MGEAGTFPASKVARLVYGYLQNSNCEVTKKMFLEECPPSLKLREFAILAEDESLGLNWDIDGQSLSDILDEYKT